ncbi:MAG: cupin domain-containing protein [Gemmatimonadaceae bacterium]
MAIEHDSTVTNATEAAKLPDGVRGIDQITPEKFPGCTVFVHYNGPTDQLSAVSMGMAVLDPGGAPHEPHRHPEEEFMLVASGTGVIECAGVSTPVGPGSVMYCAGDTIHGIFNTGAVPMTFYWSKWMARGA